MFYGTTPQEDIETIHQAQELIREALEMLDSVKRHRQWADAYPLAALSTATSNDHAYMSRDQSLDDWVVLIERGEE